MFLLIQQKKSLLLLADIATRYDLGSPSEATHGCGAAAMLISVESSISNHREINQDSIRRGRNGFTETKLPF